MSPPSALPEGDTAQESPSVPLLSLVPLFTRICFFPAHRSSPGSAVGAVQAGLVSPVSVPSPLLNLGVPKVTTAQTEVEGAIDAIEKNTIIQSRDLSSADFIVEYLWIKGKLALVSFMRSLY